jgi:hypothetical protein
MLAAICNASCADSTAVNEGCCNSWNLISLPILLNRNRFSSLLAIGVGPEVLQRPHQNAAPGSLNGTNRDRISNHGFLRINEECPYQRTGEQNASRDEKRSDPHSPLNEKAEDYGRE